MGASGAAVTVTRMAARLVDRLGIEPLGAEEGAQHGLRVLASFLIARRVLIDRAGVVAIASLGGLQVGLVVWLAQVSERLLMLRRALRGCVACVDVTKAAFDRVGIGGERLRVLLVEVRQLGELTKRL
jgi:hypothetical protein